MNAPRHLRRQKHKQSDTPPPTEQYYKSRKQLVLWSGILFAWEFIGIEINKLPFPKLNIEIKSPDAAPWVLISLILYFGYRTLMEWLHLAHSRRKVKITRWDFKISIAIPVIALLVFMIQRLLESQIYDIFPENISIIITYVVVALFWWIASTETGIKKKTRILLYLGIIATISGYRLFFYEESQLANYIPNWLSNPVLFIALSCFSIITIGIIQWELKKQTLRRHGMQSLLGE